MISRREILIALGAVAIAPVTALGQPQKAPILIAWLNTGSRESSGNFLTVFKEGLSALGWKEGTQFVLEARWADGNYARLPSLAEELAAKKPAVIVAGPLQAVIAAAKAAPATPIVQANGGDVVATGLATSLARPGGMVTGLTNMTGDISEKYLDLLLEASPKLRRAGFLLDPGNRNLSVIMDAIRRSIANRRVEVRFAEATTPEQIEPAIARLAKDGVQGLVVINSAMFRNERQRIVDLTMRRRWPTISADSIYTEAGMLLSYGIDVSRNYRRAAFYVDKILKGTKPGEIPIEQPTLFDFVVNMKTAKVLGLKVPHTIMIQATKLIE